MEPQMFLLKTTTSNKTLYHRIPDSQLLVIEPPAPEAASPSKAKGKKAKPVVQKPKIDYIFVDVAEGKEAAKKESYENYGEANAVADYLMAYHGSLDLSTTAIMSPMRTQALVIKNCIQETRKAELDAAKEGLSSFSRVGSIEDFVSRTFSTVMVSMCKTADIEEKGGSILNSAHVVDFLLSRLDVGPGKGPGKLIVFAKSESLNDLWRKAFYEAEGVEIIER